MREYLGKTGNAMYLINLDTNECRVFNKFGRLEKSMTGFLGYAECMSLTEIDILSVIGDPVMDICEVYIDGFKGTVSMGYNNLLSSLFSDQSRSKYLVDLLLYRIVHPEGVMQLLLPCKKGVVSRNFIEGQCKGHVVWTPLLRSE